MYDPLAGQKGTRRELRSLGIFVLFLAACFLLFVYPQSDDFSLSANECRALNQYWTNTLARDFALSDEWDGAPFECPAAESGLARAVMFLEGLKAPGENARPASFHDWARDLQPVLSRRILFGLAGRTDFQERTISFSPLVLEKNNWVQIAGVLIHELRHLEEGVNTHVPCVRHSGKSCDPRLLEDPAEGGAYNYNVLFFHRVAVSTKTSRYEKRLAKRELKRILEEHFNLLPTDAMERYGF